MFPYLTFCSELQTDARRWLKLLWRRCNMRKICIHICILTCVCVGVRRRQHRHYECQLERETCVRASQRQKWLCNSALGHIQSPCSRRRYLSIDFSQKIQIKPVTKDLTTWKVAIVSFSVCVCVCVCVCVRERERERECVCVFSRARTDGNGEIGKIFIYSYFGTAIIFSVVKMMAFDIWFAGWGYTHTHTHTHRERERERERDILLL